MKISIGNSKDKNINYIIQQNIVNGYSVFKHDDEYFIEVLNHNNLYVADNTTFLKMPSGQYEIKNGNLYLVE